MKFGVKVMPRDVILDTQGRAVETTLKANSFKAASCRVGRFVEIDVAIEDEAKAREEVKKIAEFVLANPLIETFQIDRL